jgi:hypothetical protein
MFIHGVRRFLVLGLFGVCGAVPAACLFSPIDYSGISSGGAGACSSAEGCANPSECRTTSCVGLKCETVSAPKDKVIIQIEHDCLKRQCDGNGNVVVVPDLGDIPENDNNGCTVEDCDDTTSPNAPAGSPCPNGVCDGNGACATCDDGIKNGNEVDVDCGGPNCPHCDGELCVGDALGCQSGHCVEGVCCSTACDKKCESCVVSRTGAPTGTCAPVLLGKPDGSKCDSLGGCGVNNLCACEDGVKNQSEPGIDCGPVCAVGCAPGTLCTGSFDCKSNECSNGVCCSTACKGECEQCNLPGSMGTCAKLPALSQGKCPMDQACNTNGECRKKAGEPCSNGQLECVSGFCSDGVCCAEACDGPCRACSSAVKGQGADGVCGFIKSGGDPDAECSTSCDGAGSCAP